jgi:metallophosphoesterase (TIGR00282 family)
MLDKFGFLFLGDVIGRPGRKVLKKYLPDLVEKNAPSFIVANGENAAGGIGITPQICQELLDHVDVLTSGNHIWDKREAISYLDKEPRLLRPANYPPKNPGKGLYVFEIDSGLKIGVLNLQGRVFMEPIDCPFRTADLELEKIKDQDILTIVDFHAEATSEKQAMGWYLDGKVSAVIGTHTHVQTADERILPQGTAFITDVGMVGGYDSVIGIKRDQAIQRFLTSRPQRFQPGKRGMIFSAVFVEVDALSGKALSIRRELIVEGERENGARG